MPIYEYVAEDGTRLELIRSMSKADEPVPDPDGKGRTFKRAHSLFAAGGAGGTGGAAGDSGGGGSGHVHSGMCGCGKRRGSCR